MNLRMTRTAESDHAPDHSALEFALVAFVVMPRARNEMMSRECFLASANRALPFHRLSLLRAAISKG